MSVRDYGVDGFLNVYKPPGMTSYAAVARLKKLTGVKKIGHAGTLDPDARGVLPIAIGRYTRLLDYCALTPKRYRAQVQIGTMTHSGDHSGEIVARSFGPSPPLVELERASHFLVGNVWQIPPQVSAIKRDGVRHYKAARTGQVVWPDPRRAEIYSISNFGLVESGFVFDASVGRGTYIRALVRDLAYEVGTAMHLAALERRQVGTFMVEESVTLDALEGLSDWRTALVPWTRCLYIPHVEVNGDEAELITHGDKRAFDQTGWEAGIIALSHSGMLMGIAEGTPWHYRVVLGRGERPIDEHEE